MVNDRSRMNREIHVRFCESLRVKLPRATRLRGWDLAVPAYSICLGKRLQIKGLKDCIKKKLFNCTKPCHNACVGCSLRRAEAALGHKDIRSLLMI